MALSKRQRRFLEYHRANPQVWLMFSQKCNLLVKAGHTRFTQRMIWENMRMDQMLSTTGDKWKLNNNYLKDYAEMYMAKNPHLGKVFETRGKAAAPVKVATV